MDNLPPTARHIDPMLAEVGVDHTFQKLVCGQVLDDCSAVVIAVLTQRHPQNAGVVGRFYGTRLRGFRDGSVFRPWRTEPLGEVRWDDVGGWVQLPGPTV